MKYSILLMAAGKSQRFKASHNGMHKLLHPINESNHSMFSVTYAATTQVFAPKDIYIIVNKEDPDVKRAAKALGSPILTIQSNGIGESIAQAVYANQNYDGLLILHADLPLIRSSTIQSVRDALYEHSIVRPMYLGKYGHPVGFQQRYFSELMQLQGDEGANKILKNHDNTSLAIDDPGITYDIDTIHDLNNLPK